MKISYAAILVTAFSLLGCTADNPDLVPDGSLADTADLSSVVTPPDGGSADLISDPGAAIAEECAKLAAAACERLGRCSPYLLRYYYGSTATCTERLQLTCAPYVNLRGSSWTVARLRACTAGYASSSCESYFAPGGPIACQPQPGALVNGTACANDNQCQSALCNNTQSGGCGTCVQPAKSGEACTTQKPCALGLSCTAGKCATSGGSGAACGTTQPPCKTGFYCKATTCAAVLAAGATCNPGTTAAECDPLQGLYCDTTTRKCVAYKVVDDGQACGATNGSYSLCAAYGTCNVNKCVAAAADNAACGSTTSAKLSCVLPAACTANFCKIFDPTTCK